MASSNFVGLPFFVVDAFTKRPFCGNPAAVCLLSEDHDLSESDMQKIAAEMNLSETAFVKVIESKGKKTFESGNYFTLRWFTPKCEVPLCGHATLATSAVIFHHMGNNCDLIEFNAVSGALYAKKLSNNQIQLDFPAYDSYSVTGQFNGVIESAVGDLPVEDVVLSTSKKLLIRLKDCVTREQLERMQVNSIDLHSSSDDIKGVIVTVKGSELCKDGEGKKYDFISRYFAPWMGIPEDPVTGSAHCVLAPYWAKVLDMSIMYARQCSVRGGELHLELDGNRVFIRGNTVIVAKGTMNF